MYEIYKKNVTIDRLSVDEKAIKKAFFTGELSSFIRSYPHFLRYFRDVEVLTDHHVVIGINFTYGWMPRMFYYKSTKSQDVLEILNNAKGGSIPDIDELTILREHFDNSLVGTSKILHFINPEKFAILDGIVYQYLAGKEGKIKNLDKDLSKNPFECTLFLDYLKFCNYITSKPGFSYLKKSIEEKVGYEMSKFRAVELIMYTSAKKKKK
jgi:hypothetical protein